MQRRRFLATLVPAGALAAPAAAPAPSPPPAPIVRAWLGAPERRHGHDALGTGHYPGRLHAVVRHQGREWPLQLELPPGGAFEDGLVRRADLGGAGSDDLVLVTADRIAGAAITVYGVAWQDGAPVLRERARSPAAGPGRWMNPIGFGDFDGDGRLEVVGVTTPHIGGVLTLYRHQPPHLVPVAQTNNVCNHAYRQLEQRLGAVRQRDGRTVVVVPDQSRHRLRTLGLAPDGRWETVAADEVFHQPIDRVLPGPDHGLQVQAGSELRLLP